MVEPQGLLKTYRGNYHCKEFVYEADIPEIHAANDCNCSICTKKGALRVFPAKESFHWVKGDEDDLTDYTFGRMLVTHKFCPTCGTSLLARGFTHEPQPGEEPEFVLKVSGPPSRPQNHWRREGKDSSVINNGPGKSDLRFEYS
ncbi:glutathione-dependent formaldehyde-activating enzyme [Apiospora hydei]|uniref:Glutathione-dependent formaldehyde-activating enzyme n=1 Tax=Apiospora hydei TaxID=1337664 RepID=A0ABR1WAN6_9PEZI